MLPVFQFMSIYMFSVFRIVGHYTWYQSSCSNLRDLPGLRSCTLWFNSVQDLLIPPSSRLRNPLLNLSQGLRLSQEVRSTSISNKPMLRTIGLLWKMVLFCSRRIHAESENFGLSSSDEFQSPREFHLGGFRRPRLPQKIPLFGPKPGSAEYLSMPEYSHSVT